MVDFYIVWDTVINYVTELREKLDRIPDNIALEENQKLKTMKIK